MKKNILCLALTCALLCGAAAIAEEMPGVTLENETYLPLEDDFRTLAFDKTLIAATLSDSLAIIFDETADERFLPNLSLSYTADFPTITGEEGMLSFVIELVQAMNLIQDVRPDTPAINRALTAEHEASGLGIVLGEESLWLWAENGKAVMLPLYFYNETTGQMIDGLYLLSILQSGEASGWVNLYNDPAILMSYLGHVEVNSEQSDFQRAMIAWYLVTHHAAAPTPAQAAQPSVADGSGYLGTVFITAKNGSAHVREDSNEQSTSIWVVLHDQRYFVTGIAENGWYQIEHRDGRTGYISPLVVKFNEY